MFPEYSPHFSEVAEGRASEEVALIFLSDYKGPGLGRENAFSGHSIVFHLGNRGFRNKSIVYLLEYSSILIFKLYFQVTQHSSQK